MEDIQPHSEQDPAVSRKEQRLANMIDAMLAELQTTTLDTLDESTCTWLVTICNATLVEVNGTLSALGLPIAEA